MGEGLPGAWRWQWRRIERRAAGGGGVTSALMVSKTALLFISAFVFQPSRKGYESWGSVQTH